MRNLSSDLQKQDEYFKSNISNMVSFAEARDTYGFTLFLDERQQLLAEEILRHEKWGNFLFFGGYDQSERKILGVFPRGYNCSDIAQTEELFPIASYRFKVPESANLSHRDCLGSLMGLQLKRETIGDIVVSSKECATIFLHENIASFVLQNLNKVGSYSVYLEKASKEAFVVIRELLPHNGTVPSLRLDCVVALLCGTSRTIAAQTIASGIVKVNCVECSNNSKILSPEDVIVIRGKGKFILENSIKKTKKDRLFVTINQLL